MPIFAIRNEQIYSGVCCGNPNVKFVLLEVLFDLASHQILSSMNREQWPHQKFPLRDFFQLNDCVPSPYLSLGGKKGQELFPRRHGFLRVEEKFRLGCGYEEQPRAKPKEAQISSIRCALSAATRRPK